MGLRLWRLLGLALRSLPALSQPLDEPGEILPVLRQQIAGVAEQGPDLLSGPVGDRTLIGGESRFLIQGGESDRLVEVPSSLVVAVVGERAAQPSEDGRK